MSQQTQREILASSDRDKPKFVWLVFKEDGTGVLLFEPNGSNAGLRGSKVAFCVGVGLGQTNRLRLRFFVGTSF